MTLENMDSLIRKLNALGGNSQKALRVGVLQATKYVQGQAKLLAPVDDGQLRNSIQASVETQGDQITGKVSTNVEYAAYVEFGTGQRGEQSPSPPKSPENLSYRQDWAGMSAQPYMYPALRNNESKVRSIVASAVRKEIRKLEGGGR